MKFNIEIDATPAEARAFLGLPDVTPLHELWVGRMKALGLESPLPENWEQLVQGWTSALPALAGGLGGGLSGWQKFFQAATSTASDNEAPKKKD